MPGQSSENPSTFIFRETIISPLTVITNRQIQLLLGASCACGIMFQPSLKAEEGGTGHYLPGSISSFVDGTPPDPAFVARFNGGYCNASLPGSLPLSGIRPAPLNVNAESFGGGLTLLWRPSFELAPGLSYAMNATIPYVSLTVDANVGIGPVTVRRSSSVSSLGDIVLMPLMLNYAVTEDFHVDFRTGIYAPTGDYEVGRLANSGKNFWTVEPTIGFLYFGKKNGIEASVYAGTDFNSENEDTHYKSGTQFHLDGTVAQHFHLLGGLTGVGVAGYWYTQVTGDSGSGATLGSFEGFSTGVGPVVSYACKLGGKDLVTEAKWLHDVETKKRLEGDYVWLRVVLKF